MCIDLGHASTMTGTDNSTSHSSSAHAHPQLCPSDQNNERNIIIIGKVGVGKSTIANAIFSSTAAAGPAFPVGSSVRSTVRSPRDNITRKHKIDGYKYSITVVDTVGLGSKKQIVERLVQSFRQNKRIHLLIFVIKLDRLTDEEIESIRKIQSHLTRFYNRHTLQQITALVISHCETIVKQEREKIRKQYGAQNSKIYELVRLAKGKVHLVGLPDMQTVNAKLKALIQEERDEDVKTLQDIVKDVCANPSPEEIVYKDLHNPLAESNGSYTTVSDIDCDRCCLF